MRSYIAFTLSLLAMFAPKSVVAASFNCVTDRGPDEKAICRDATLSHLDEEMDQAYRSAINTSGSQPDAIRDAQRAFLQQRRSCGSSINCIGSLYKSRLMQLQPGQPRFGAQVAINPASCPFLWVESGQYKYCFCGDKDDTVAQLASDGDPLPGPNFTKILHYHLHHHWPMS